MCSMNFIRGMGVGLVVGMAAGIAVTPKKKKSPMAGKLIKAVGDIVDNIGGVLGL